MRICPTLRLTFTERIRLFTKRYATSQNPGAHSDERAVRAPRRIQPEAYRIHARRPAYMTNRPGTGTTPPCDGPHGDGVSGARGERTAGRMWAPAT